MKLPVLGPFGTLVWLDVFGGTLIHRGGSSTKKGFQITYLQGLTASVVVARGTSVLVIPIQTLQASGADNSAVSLLRLRPSNKDSARIVRSTHVAITQTKSQINPVSTEVLGTEQDVVASKTEAANGNLILTPNAPLEAGEYALVAPAQAAGTAAWDFTVR